MGWFSKNNEAPAQTFGTPTYGGMGMANQMGGGNNAMMGGGGMGAMMMSQQAQNPMMQQMANDPITATARLLDFNDPVSDFIVSQNFAMLIELMGGVVTLASLLPLAGVGLWLRHTPLTETGDTRQYRKEANCLIATDMVKIKPKNPIIISVAFRF